MYSLKINDEYNPIITKDNFLTDSEIVKVFNLTKGYEYEKGLTNANIDCEIKSLKKYYLK